MPLCVIKRFAYCQARQFPAVRQCRVQSLHTFSRTSLLLILVGNAASPEGSGGRCESSSPYVQIDVDSAGSFGEARIFWTTGSYRLILLSPRDTPQESIDFFEMVKRENPSQRIAFLVGSPEYVSFVIPEGMVAA